MKEFWFINLPVMELWNPSAAMAALTPYIHEAGYKPVHKDLNISLFEDLSEEQWSQLIEWCEFITPTIDQEILNQIDRTFARVFGDLDNVAWIGISVFSFVNAKITARLLHMLTSISNRNFKLLLGGNGCSSSLAIFDQLPFGEYALNHNLTDHVIFADGELALQALLSNNLPFPGVDEQNFQQIKNLDDLLLPDYTSMDFSKYKDSRVLVTGSRGCVRKCTFCDIELTWPKYAYRSPHLVLDEMRKHVNELGITNFEFTDSLINGSVSNFAKFNELLAEAKIKEPEMANVTYMGQAICRNKAHMGPSIYESMYYAGCKQLIIGIESFSERVRTHMKKKFSDNDIDYHLEQCSRWNIPNVFLMIVGYPTETLQDHESQLKSVRKYADYAKTGTIFMLRWGLTMHIYENTPITKYAKDLQLMHTGDQYHDSLFTWVSVKNKGLDLKERIRRRIELHELSTELGYCMPNAKNELQSMLTLAKLANDIPSNPTLIPVASSY